MISEYAGIKRPLNVSFPYDEGADSLELQLSSLQDLLQKEDLYDSLMIIVERVDDYVLADLKCLLNFIQTHAAKFFPPAQNFFFFVVDAARRTDPDAPKFVRLLLDFLRDVNADYAPFEAYVGLVREIASRQNEYSLSITLQLIHFFRRHILPSSLVLKEMTDSIPYLLAMPSAPEVNELVEYLLMLVSSKEDYLPIFSPQAIVTTCISEERQGISWEILLKSIEKLTARRDENACFALSALLDSIHFPMELQAAFTTHVITYYYDRETHGNYPHLSSDDNNIRKIQAVYARCIAALALHTDEQATAMLHHIMEHIGIYPFCNSEPIRGLSILCLAMKQIVSQHDDHQSEQAIRHLLDMIQDFPIERKTLCCLQEKWIEWIFSLIGESPSHPKVVACLWGFIQSLSPVEKNTWERYGNLPQILLFTAWVPPRDGLQKEGFRHRWSNPLLRIAVLKRLLDFVRPFRASILEEVLSVLPLQHWKRESSEWKAIIEYESIKNTQYTSLTKLVCHLLSVFWPDKESCHLLFNLIKHQNMIDNKAMFQVISSHESECFSLNYLQWFDFCMKALQVTFQEAVSLSLHPDEHLNFVTALIQRKLNIVAVPELCSFMKNAPLPVWQVFLDRRFDVETSIKILLLFFRDHSVNYLDCHHIVLKRLLNSTVFDRVSNIIRFDVPVIVNVWNNFFGPVTLQSYFLEKMASKNPQKIIDVSEIMLLLLDINQMDLCPAWEQMAPVLKQHLEIEPTTPENSYRQLVFKFIQNAVFSNRLPLSIKTERLSLGTQRTESMSNGPPSPYQTFI